jgi:hypothetical protein
MLLRLSDVVPHKKEPTGPFFTWMPTPSDTFQKISLKEYPNVQATERKGKIRRVSDFFEYDNWTNGQQYVILLRRMNSWHTIHYADSSSPFCGWAKRERASARDESAPKTVGIIV